MHKRNYFVDYELDRKDTKFFCYNERKWNKKQNSFLILICSQDPGLTLSVSFLNEKKNVFEESKGLYEKKKKVESNPLFLFISVGERGMQHLKSVV